MISLSIKCIFVMAQNKQSVNNLFFLEGRVFQNELAYHQCLTF